MKNKSLLSLLFISILNTISFAQCYLVNPIPYSPDSATGISALANIDDTWSGVIPIGFNFCFYGTTYNQCVIGSNEVISFNQANATNYNTWPISAPIPSTTPTDLLNSIMAPWQDVDPSVSGSITYDTNGIAPNRRFIVSFNNIPLYNTSCNNLFSTSQIILYETSNAIEIHILKKDTCSVWNNGAAIEGLQDQTGTSATVVPGRNYPVKWTATNDGYKFVPTCPPCGNALSAGEINDPNDNISIYPNPSSGSISIRSVENISLIEIYNVLGEKVFSKTSNNKQETIYPDILNGIYSIKIKTTGKSGDAEKKFFLKK